MFPDKSYEVLSAPSSGPYFALEPRSRTHIQIEGVQGFESHMFRIYIHANIHIFTH